MRRLAVTAAIAAIVVTGCQSSTPVVRQSSPVVQQVAMTTLASGWRVDCNEDHFTNSKRCFAGTFGSAPGFDRSIPFQVYFENGRGPAIMPGFNTYPGRTATIRVDSGAIRSANAAQAVINDLRSGSIAYVVYHSWPEGEKRMTVDLTGFTEAYDLLLSKR